MKNSRTILSLTNSAVALGFYFVNLILQFYSRRIFFIELGTDVLGLNTTTSSLLQFLNLAELGVGSAIGVTLYKPLVNNDYEAVNEIVSIQGYLYKRIAVFIITGSLALMCFFPLIFAKASLPLWYVFTSYSVLLFSALLGYFFNYKQIALSASQHEYYIRFSYNASMIAKVVFQIIALQIFENPYVWWLILEASFAIIASLSLSYMVKKKCPYLKTDTVTGKNAQKKYPEVITKVKQMFFHKASRYALTQTSPLIIYGYASLTLVAIYGNYMLVVTGLASLLTAMFDSTNAGVGNLVAEGDRTKILGVFRELFSSRFLIVSVITYCFYTMADSFISIWIGPDYLLDRTCLLLVVIIFYLNTSRTVVDSFINAYGLFRDIAAPIVEACINVGFSILLGYYFGLQGILSGVALSLFLVVFCWKPYFLFKRGLLEKLGIYIKMYIKHFAVFFLSAIISSILLPHILIDSKTGIFSFIINALLSAIILGSLELTILYYTEEGMRRFVNRIKHVLR